MSVAAQAVAARRKAKQDVRYRGQKTKDLSVKEKRMRAMIAEERARQQRKSSKR